jgi:hypothetical protein
MSNSTDPLLAEIEAVLALYGVSATRFGYLACGDAAVVGRMRNGMRPRSKRRADLVAALSKVKEGKL